MDERPDASSGSRRKLVFAPDLGDKQPVPAIAHVAIHSSQFPENVRRDLLASLRSREVNHKFHYDSVKQTQKWLALHETLSPSRNDADCAATYDRSFAGAAARIESRRVHLIGLGCGGGQKDTRLLKLLKQHRQEALYTPCDVSAAMVLVASQTALAVLPEDCCFPFVCDLAAAADLPALFETPPSRGAARLITFFGMIPNFEPDGILPKLAALVRAGDYLLFSANLAPGADYAAGLRRVLPQYDNPAIRDWLLTFLLDLGVERGDGELRFTLVDGAVGSGLKKIVARFHFTRPRQVEIEDQAFTFEAGADIQLFFSYRYTPALVRATLHRYGLAVVEEWITASQEEGIFLCQRS